MRQKLFVILGFAIAIFGMSELRAEEAPELEWRWDFSHPEVLDRDNISALSLFACDGLSYAADRYLLQPIKNDDRSEQRMVLAATLIALGFAERPILRADHEYGHFQAMSRFGLRDFVLNADHVGNPLEVTQKAFGQIYGNDDWIASVDQSDWNRFWGKPELAANHHRLFALMEAGGLNQDQHTLELFQDRIVSGQARLLDIVPWFLKLNATLWYARSENDDIDDYAVELEKSTGIKTSRRRIKNLQWLKYISGSSGAALDGLVSFWRDGATDLHLPFSVSAGQWKFYWPEFASYLTTEGVTLKIIEPVSIADKYRLKIIYQQSLDTNSREFGFNFRTKEESWIQPELSAFWNTDGGHWIEAGAKLSIFSWLKIGLTGYSGSGYTFEREINGKVYPCLEEHERGIQGSISISFDF